MEQISRPFVLTCTNIPKKGEKEISYQPAVFSVSAEALIPDIMKYMVEIYPVSVEIKVRKLSWSKGENGIMEPKHTLISKQNIIKKINKPKNKKDKENEIKED